MSLSRVLVFLSVVLAIDVGLHYFVWARLVRDTAVAAPYARIASGVLIVLAFIIPITFVVGRSAPRVVAAPLAWAAFVWLGFLFFLFFLLLPLELVRLGAFVSGKPSDPDRRQFFVRALGVFVAATTAVMGGAGLYFGLQQVPVKRVTVPLAKFPKAISGYTIVQLTDVHVGPTIGREFIDDLVSRTNALHPDLVAITGDLVDGSVEDLGPLLASLGKLRAKDGVYFVTGNHEYYSGADAWIAHLGTLGIRVLRNEHLPIRGVEGFDLAGVDDATAHQFGKGHGMNVKGALEGRDPARALILLAHQPKAIVDAALHGVDLQLSGHTHGGQLFPWNLFVKLDQPYVAGLHVHEGTTIYVSCGTGYWGPPMRLGAPAEITRIELISAS
jgi:predicted MPP superfamily phosphohydrolase